MKSSVKLRTQLDIQVAKQHGWKLIGWNLVGNTVVVFLISWLTGVNPLALIAVAVVASCITFFLFFRKVFQQIAELRQHFVNSFEEITNNVIDQMQKEFEQDA